MAGEDPLRLIGQTLDGAYRVDSVVGQGGFGVVYRGYHLAFEQPVAVKCLRIPGDFEPDTRQAFLKKFREEGRLLYQLSQGTLGIVRSIALGDVTSPNGIWTPFVVLEWLEGLPLSVDLEQRAAQRLGGRSLTEMLKLFDMPARALAYAHQHRVAHRDIKPANLFLIPSQPIQGVPTVKVLDFGIAKVMAEGANATRANATQMGFSSFTPQYAAPEQFDPRFGSTGPWSDVYAFAILLVEVLTNTPVYGGRDAVDIMADTLGHGPRPTPRNRGVRLPDAIEAVFARAMALSPKDRFADVGAFWDALLAARVSATPATVPMAPNAARLAAPPMSAEPSRSPAMPAAYSNNPAPPFALAPGPMMGVRPPARASAIAPRSSTDRLMWIVIGVGIAIVVMIGLGILLMCVCVAVS